MARVRSLQPRCRMRRNGGLLVIIPLLGATKLKPVATLASAAILAVTVFAAQASTSVAGDRLSGGAVAQPALVPPGDILVADASLRLAVLDQNGNVLRRLPWWHARSGSYLDGLELAPDRRHAFVSVDGGDLPTRLYEVDLATGGKRLLADAVSPALSPNGSRLLYLANRRPKNLTYPLLTALVVRNLSSGRQRVIPFRSRLVIGTPPDIVTNWSLDGRHAVLFDGSELRLVDIATAHSVESQPLVGTPYSPSGNHSLAPVFLDAHRLVVLSDCCMGRQHLVTVDLRTGRQAAFAEISSPVVSIRRLGRGQVLVADQLGQLLIVSHGRVRVISNGVSAASA
jgi:hypothetical protein